MENLTVLGQVCPDGDGLRVGGIVGENYGTLVHCSFSGTVKGKIDTGGIAGTNDGTLQDCQAQGQPSGKVENLTVLGQVCPDGDGLRVGGIVGENYGTLVHCSFSGTVKGKIDTGGIAGTNDGTLQDCQAQGSITGKKRTGGIVGYNSGTVSGGRSEARINIESVDPAVDVKDLHLDLTIDLAQKADRDTLDAPSDTGGIAGYSSGTWI